jgi:hypothetical protein
MDMNAGLDAVVALNEDEAAVVIHQPNGEPYLGPDGEPCKLFYVGKESKRYRAARREVTRQQLKSRKANMEPEDLRRNRVKQASAAVVRWSGWEDNGHPAECTQENVAKLLRIDHILEQLEEAIEAHADFFKSSSSS